MIKKEDKEHHNGDEKLLEGDCVCNQNAVMSDRIDDTCIATVQDIKCSDRKNMFPTNINEVKMLLSFLENTENDIS